MQPVRRPPGSRSPGSLTPWSRGPVPPRSIQAPRNLQDLPGAPIPFGVAQYFGTLTLKDSGSGIAAIAASQNGRGYLLVTASGGVFNFGDARFHGDARCPA